MPARSAGDRLRAALEDIWWSPRRSWRAFALWPLSLVYELLRRLARRATPPRWTPPCPVIVVGNLVVGGAGKTPTVIALVHALRAAGHKPGVVSRGYGRRSTGVLAVGAEASGAEVGDEPLLIRRATGVPVVVGARRTEAAQALLAAHPEVDLIVSDDGLQHTALARDAEVWVFDDRGVGNGWLLPAGPLRQRLPRAVPDQAFVLYNASAPSTPLPGRLASRRLSGAVALAAWHEGAAMQASVLDALRGRPVLAVAGIASPSRFFTMLRDSGLDIDERPQPDHAAFDVLPWAPGTPDVVCTEKDAVKLDPQRCAGTRVWVVGLDLRLPPQLVEMLSRRITTRETPWTTD